jgi:hypothetical protein
MGSTLFVGCSNVGRLREQAEPYFPSATTVYEVRSGMTLESLVGVLRGEDWDWGNLQGYRLIVADVLLTSLVQRAGAEYYPRHELENKTWEEHLSEQVAHIAVIGARLRSLPEPPMIVYLLVEDHTIRFADERARGVNSRRRRGLHRTNIRRNAQLGEMRRMIWEEVSRANPRRTHVLRVRKSLGGLRKNKGDGVHYTPQEATRLVRALYGAVGRLWGRQGAALEVARPLPVAGAGLPGVVVPDTPVRQPTDADVGADGAGGEDIGLVVETEVQVEMPDAPIEVIPPLMSLTTHAGGVPGNAKGSGWDERCARGERTTCREGFPVEGDPRLRGFRRAERALMEELERGEPWEHGSIKAMLDQMEGGFRQLKLRLEEKYLC